MSRTRTSSVTQQMMRESKKPYFSTVFSILLTALHEIIDFTMNTDAVQYLSSRIKSQNFPSFGVSWLKMSSEKAFKLTEGFSLPSCVFLYVESASTMFSEKCAAIKNKFGWTDEVLKWISSTANVFLAYKQLIKNWFGEDVIESESYHEDDDDDDDDEQEAEEEQKPLTFIENLKTTLEGYDSNEDPDYRVEDEDEVSDDSLEFSSSDAESEEPITVEEMVENIPMESRRVQLVDQKPLEENKLENSTLSLGDTSAVEQNISKVEITLQ